MCRERERKIKRERDNEGYSSSSANLKMGIRIVKHNHKRRIEEHFHNNSDPRRMWQGIKSLADYQKVNTPPPDNATLLDELNHLYARFDRDNKTPALKLLHPRMNSLSASPPLLYKMH